ncbi:FXYD domain containing ion transport regulator 7 [Megalops cyprinoides]|uniref:FXYD domain containing ion transport regulator 7 n=1 Tax=Megalops cyprinoides TaxID=118141 RepID=UPI00186433C5|nr:FXYD domain containing ion transport regulator 7 [Megalops cyprinoides]
MATTGESMVIDQSAFEYDYETLRTTGVILAVVMFVLGILIALTLAQLKAHSQQRQKCPLRQYKERAVGAREGAAGCRRIHAGERKGGHRC